MARFELAGDTVEGWIETSADAIAFRTRRGTDAAIERMRARIDTDGHPEPHEDDVRAAYVAFQRNCFARGWRRIPDPPRELVQTELREPALEAALLAPDADVSAWSVYADWFQERGHPRGELIALHLRAETDPEFSVRNAATHRGLVPGGPGLALGWRRGFIDWAQLQVSRTIGVSEDVLWDLLRHPSARLLRRLELSGGSYTPLLTDVLLHTHAPPIRELVVGPLVGSGTALGDLGALGDRYPRLVNVELRGDDSVVLRGLRLPVARRVVVEAHALRRPTLAAILGAIGPELETLELTFGYRSECRARDLAALFDGSLHLPRLRTLRLAQSEFADDICKLLAGSTLVRQLATLDLHRGRLTDESVAMLHAIRSDLHVATGSAARRADTAPRRR